MPVVSLTRVSTDSAGGEAATGGVFGVLSDDGTRILFLSSDPLVPGDTNATNDVFMKTLATGAVVRVSTDSAGVQTAGSSGIADFTPDGTRVVFTNSAALTGGVDVNGASADVFIKDLATGVVTRISETAGGVALVANSSINPGGVSNAFVAFTSDGAVGPGDANTLYDIYRKDLATGAVERASVAQGGADSDGTSSGATISADGAKVAFLSLATNLLATADLNGAQDVFVKDMASGAVILVSAAADGTPGNGVSADAAISADGTKVVFSSAATNLVAGDTNNRSDIFVKTLATGAIERVSTSSAGVQANLDSALASISPNGRYVAFVSNASNLVAGDLNGAADVFVKDLTTGQTSLVSVRPDGVQGGPAFYLLSPSITDALKVAFDSTASNLVAGDTNANLDSFVAVLQAAAPAPGPAGPPDPNDNLLGGSGDDTLLSGDGDDILRGWYGADSLGGEAGRDTLSGGPGNDSLHGGQGDDNVAGDEGDDQLQGNQGADVLDGGLGADTLYGGQGGDRIVGGDGNDRLSGDLGNDVLNGGAGADRFVFGKGGGQDWVEDFHFAEGDRVQLAPGTAYTVVDFRGWAMIVLGDGDQIGLVGDPFSAFSRDWVVFA